MDDFSSNDDGALLTSSAALLQTMLDNVSVRIEVLKPVRDGIRIIDFEYIIVNASARQDRGHVDLTSKYMIDGSGHVSGRFQNSVEVIDTGKTYSKRSFLKIDGKERPFNETYVKSGDLLIILREEIPEGLSSRLTNHDGTGAQTKKANTARETDALKSGDKDGSKSRTNKFLEKTAKEDIHLISQVMDMTPDIIYIMDLDTGQLIYCNRQVAADLGYSDQQIAAFKNPVFDIMHEEDIPAMMAHLKVMQTLENDQIVLEIEYRLKNSEGGYTWFIDRNAVFTRNKANEPIEKIAICQNITTRKQEGELRLASEEIIQQAEEVVAIGSWEYDILEANLKWSKGMYRLFNLDRNDKVRPEIYLENSKPEEYLKAQSVVNKILRDFVDFEETITLLSKGREEKIVKIKAIVQHDHHLRPVKIIGVDLDITQQVKATKAINELYDSIVKKNRELHALGNEIKTFNIVAAHDYKETLQQLYTNLEYIISNDARNLSNTGKGNIRRAQSAIQRMHLLTDDINIYFKLFDIDVKLVPVDSLQILKAVINKHQLKLEQYNAKVEFDSLPMLLSHTELLTQLFTNLIDNAIKFRNLLVPLVIKLTHSSNGEKIDIPGALRNTAYVIISISDNGLGFSQEEAEKIFEIFYRRAEGKERGTGIGLAICNRIMALHDGLITAEGLPAKGATFNCCFPLRP